MTSSLIPDMPYTLAVLEVEKWYDHGETRTLSPIILPGSEDPALTTAQLTET